MNTTIPRTEIVMSERDPPWFSPLLKHLINQRWIAYRNKNFVVYHNLKVRIKNLIAESKSNWAKSCTHSVKNLWNVVNNVTGHKSNCFPSFLSDFTDISSAVNAINDNLVKVFVSRDSHLLTKYNELIAVCGPQNVFIDSNTVYNSIVKYSMNKSCGSDLIPIKLYHSVAHSISDILCHIFNECIRTCTFPDIWKIAHIACIPKTANATITDIRHISLLPFPSKIFERILLNFCSYLFSKCYGENQFGFRQHSSTNCALIHLHDSINKYLGGTDIKGVQMM